MRVLPRKLLSTLALFSMTLQVWAQAEGVDTTSAGYQIGYEIGNWLPFIIIFTLALMVVIRSYRLSQKNGPNKL